MKRGESHLIAKTELTLFGQTFSRGQYFPQELFRRLPEHRQQQMWEVHFVRKAEPPDEVERCDQCGAEFCRREFVNQHKGLVHLQGRVNLDGPTLATHEDSRLPIEREGAVLTDTEFDARIRV